MTDPYSREISASLKRIAAAMETIAANIKATGAQATIAGQSLADAVNGLNTDQIQFIFEDGE